MVTSEPILLSDFPGLMYDRLVPLSELHLLRNPGIATKKTMASQENANFHHYLNYWRRNGLLPFIEKGQWGKLSFVQLIWIQILESMREFGLSLDIMKNVCDYFFLDAYNDNVPKKNLSYTKKLLEEKQTAGMITLEEKNHLEFIKRNMSNEQWFTTLKYDINYLTNLIVACIKENWLGGIVIFTDGTVGEFINGSYTTHKKEVVNPEKPHVYLPLKYYLSTFFDDSELAAMVNPVLLTEDEKLIVREIRKGNIREVRVEVEKGKIKRFDSTKEGTISKEEAKEIMQRLGMKNYERIVLETRDEKTISIKRTKKNLK